MREIIGYIANYTRRVNKPVLLLCSFQTVILILLNYHKGLERWLTTRETLFWPEFTGHYLLFATAFVLPYFFYFMLEKKNFFNNKLFCALLVVAPAIFSLKMALHTNLPFSNDTGWNEYWNGIYYWPVRLVMIISILYFNLESDLTAINPFMGLRQENSSGNLMYLCCSACCH